uniref:Uncharacterized protein n=1 Tax=Spermophilus dauricus TaxID=99837 RepID=A0A8C9PEZ4_SPEDA
IPDLIDFITTGDVGTSVTFPMQCSALCKNGFVVLNGWTCKSIMMYTLKTDKHIHTKKNVICLSTHNMDIHKYERNELQMINIQDGYLAMFRDSKEVLEELHLPEEELRKETEQRYDGEDHISSHYVKYQFPSTNTVLLIFHSSLYSESKDFQLICCFT